MKSVAESASPPPPPPPPRRSWSSSSSVTRREIEKFWRKKRLVEEEHFLAAIKAAARLRAARLSQEDYLMFLEDIQEEGASATNKGIAGKDPRGHQGLVDKEQICIPEPTSSGQRREIIRKSKPTIQLRAQQVLLLQLQVFPCNCNCDSTYSFGSGSDSASSSASISRGVLINHNLPNIITFFAFAACTITSYCYFCK